MTRLFGEELIKTMKEQQRKFWLTGYEENRENGMLYCINCGKDLPKRRRKYCCDDCWTTFWGLYDSAFVWGSIRWKAMERDGFKCQYCGYTAPDGRRWIGLEVHHVKPRCEGGTDDMDNLITLCKECHKKETGELLRRLGRRQSPDQKRLDDFF